MIKTHSVILRFLIIILAAVLLLSIVACSTSPSLDADFTINLSASENIFDKTSITVPAGAIVAIVFDNKDSVLHNFALYETSAATNSFFVGELISRKTITYIFMAPTTPGTYFFRCDLHPIIMTGNFIVN